MALYDLTAEDREVLAALPAEAQRLVDAVANATTPEDRASAMDAARRALARLRGVSAEGEPLGRPVMEGHEEKRAKARRMRAQGDSIRKIAQRLGVGYGSVSRWTKDAESEK